ncbi:MAG: polysaccharide pyruvyl transferase family protein [Microgenomates group bacterium]
MCDKSVVVTNLYGGHNIGDMAIRNQAIEILTNILPNFHFDLLVENPDHSSFKFTKNFDYSLSSAPYVYAINNLNPHFINLNKFGNTTLIVINSLFYILIAKTFPKFLPSDGFYSYIKKIKEAKAVFAMGGGYFITTHPIKDFFGLILNLLPLIVSRIFKKKVIVLPSSYGPFASNFHRELFDRIIKDSIFYSRESVSYKKVSEVTQLSYIFPDLALRYWNDEIFIKPKSNYIILTFRSLLNKNKKLQKKLENQLAQFINEIYKKHKLKTIFLPMASNPIEENDLEVAYELQKIVNNNNVFTIKHASTPDEVRNILAGAKLSVCNRLHSAILSATVNVPFISISYAHKTIGFMKDFNLSKYNIDMKVLDSNSLINLSNDLLKPNNYNSYLKILQNNRLRTLSQVFSFENHLEKIIYKIINSN